MTYSVAVLQGGDLPVVKVRPVGLGKRKWNVPLLVGPGQGHPRPAWLRAIRVLHDDVTGLDIHFVRHQCRVVKKDHQPRTLVTDGLASAHLCHHGVTRARCLPLLWRSGSKLGGCGGQRRPRGSALIAGDRWIMASDSGRVLSWHCAAAILLPFVNTRALIRTTAVVAGSMTDVVHDRRAPAWIRAQWAFVSRGNSTVVGDVRCYAVSARLSSHWLCHAEIARQRLDIRNSWTQKKKKKSRHHSAIRHLSSMPALNKELASSPWLRILYVFYIPNPKHWYRLSLDIT